MRLPVTSGLPPTPDMVLHWANRRYVPTAEMPCERFARYADPRMDEARSVLAHLVEAIPQTIYAFDVLALDGDDLRALPLSLRKTNRMIAISP